jgi:hypothetical protein
MQFDFGVKIWVKNYKAFWLNLCKKNTGQNFDFICVEKHGGKNKISSLNDHDLNWNKI